MKHLTQQNFNDEIAKGVILVDFFAEWCGPCRMLTPILEQLEKEVVGKAIIGKIDTDAAPEIAARLGITSIPTLILFKDGKEVRRLVGLKDAATLRQLIDSAQ
jgi:thioredoxin 1